METRNRQTQTKKNPSKWISLRQLISGDILTSKKVVRWYPFVAYLFILMILSVYNSKLIQQKEEKLATLENEFQIELGNLKKNNQFITYEQQEKIITVMKSRGFVMDNKNIININVKGE